MRIGIGIKLFTSVLLASIVMAVAMGFATRISFQRGFLGYLNELDAKRMNVLTAILAAHWRGIGEPSHAWDTLRGRDDLWRHIVRYAGYRVHASDRPLLDLPPLFGVYPDYAACAISNRSVVPGQASAMLDADLDLPWPSEAERRARDDMKASLGPHPFLPMGRPYPPHDEGPPPPRLAPTPKESLLDVLVEPTAADYHRPSKPPDAAERMTLQAADGSFVVGNPDPGPDANYVPILVDGVVAGWIASKPFVEVTDAADLAFQQRQESAAWYVGGLALLLAGVIAWLLGRMMLVPTRRLAAATHALADGNYDIRVPQRSRDELGDLARVFNRLARTLQQNESLRRAFMADVSHELRTPLAIMRGELEAVEDGLQPLDERVVQSLQAEVGILSKLVDDIHVLSMAEVAPLSYQWQVLDVVALVDAVLPGWHERLAAKGLQLKRVGVVDKMQVSGDPNRLRQVFQNLLENTARYVDAGAQVQVGCRAGGLGVIITVDDSGPGMSADEHQRLFDRFYRREASRNRATGGSGLGLAICRGIVEAHGGTIVAQNSPLGGLRIRIELPLASSSGGKV